MTTKGDKGKPPSARRHRPGADKLLDIAGRLALKIQCLPERTSTTAYYCSLLANPTRRNMLRLDIFLRDEGIAGPEESFKDIANQVSDMAFDHCLKSDKEINRIDRAIEEAEKKHGQDYDSVNQIAGAPDDIRQLHDAWEKRHHEIEAGILREYGQNEMADLLLADPAEYHRRVDAGRVAEMRKVQQDRAAGTDDMDIAGSVDQAAARTDYQDAAFFRLAANADADVGTMRFADPEYQQIVRDIQAIERANDLGIGYYEEEVISGRRDQLPPEVEKLFAALDARGNAIMIARLREYGAGDMADLFVADPAEYRRREAAGKDAWTKRLRECAAPRAENK